MIGQLIEFVVVKLSITNLEMSCDDAYYTAQIRTNRISQALSASTCKAAPAGPECQEKWS